MQGEIRMKKILLVYGLFLLSFNIFAADFLAGGNLKFNLGRSSDSTLADYTDFGLDLFFGRYVLDNLAVGGKIGYYCTNFIHKALSIGAFVEYDFLKLQYFSFGIIPSFSYFYYHRTDESLVDRFDFDRNSIELAAALQINLFLTKNIEIFTSFLNARFQHQWWDKTNSGIKSKYSMNIFNIEGLNDLNVGVRFKF